MNNVENLCVRYYYNTYKSNMLYSIIMERAKKLLEEDCKNIVKRL